MNVLRGERDGDLSPLARERIVAFRERRSAWAAHARDAGTARGARDRGRCRTLRRASRRNAGARRAPRVPRRRGAGAHRPLRRTPSRRRARRCARDAGAHRAGRTRTAGRTPPAPAACSSARSTASARGASITCSSSTRAPDRFRRITCPMRFCSARRTGWCRKMRPATHRPARTAKFTWYSHHTKLNAAYAREHRRLLALAHVARRRQRHRQRERSRDARHRRAGIRRRTRSSMLGR